MEKKSFIKEFRSAMASLFRTLRLAWIMDKKLVLGYYTSAAIVSIIPILLAIALKYLIDTMVRYQGSGAINIPSAVIIVVLAYYLIYVTSVILRWGLYFGFFDYLLRYKFQNFLTLQFTRKLSELDMGHLEDPEVQNLLTKTRDTFMWRMPDFLRVFSYIFGSIATLILAASIAASYAWWIPVVILVAAIPRFVLRARQGNIQWSIYGSGAPEVRKLWYFNWLLTTNSAIREMKIFQSQEALLGKYKSIQDYLYNLNKKPVLNFLKIMLALPVLEVIVLVAVTYWALPSVIAGLVTIGSLTLLINTIDQLSGAASGIGGNMGEFYEDSLYASFFFEVSALKKLIPEDPDPVEFEKIESPKIEFKNVSFAYPNGSLVLKDVSFVINKGESVALVGINGAGKSTIIKLLCRFYDVSDGEILINGVNIKKIKLSNWYKFLGTLFQDFVQYHFTVEENIMLGDTGKKDDKLMKEAARKAGADEFIEKLKDGYKQVLGKEFEDGDELSGGQWQKLAIARAFYESPPVLIMDEPTSAIDAEAEYAIFNNLEKEYQNKSLILVSHRFSTVRNAKKILVIEDGQISESGSHAQLMALNGKYAKMFKTQAKGYK